MSGDTTSLCVWSSDVCSSDLNLTTGGALTIADVDQGQSTFTAQPSTAGTYGTFTLDAAGNWTYTAADSQAAIQQLGAEIGRASCRETVSTSGTANQLITVPIHGPNDVPVIGGPATGAVIVKLEAAY